MHHHLLLLRMFAGACGLLAGVATAQAAANETWVSGTGSDVGSCPVTAPCRTFAFAHGQTNDNGTINVLSSGNFGPVTITKPISIVADGVEAVINTASNGGAIIVQANAAGVVSLRGLTIDLRGTNDSGIVFISGRALHVSDSVIRKTLDGFFFIPSATAELYVTDSVVEDSGSMGIWIDPQSSAGARVVIDRVR